MPILNIDTYKIDFLILESNDPKTIVLLDRSNYLETPEKPLLEVTLPGFTGHIEIPYIVNGITVLNSDDLGLTEPCDYDYLADLPDGVYQIKQKVCPYDELFTKKCYLKTQCLEESFSDLILLFDTNCQCIDEKKFKNEILDIQILIMSAKAEIKYCNIQKAIQKYSAASKKISSLNKKLNCK